MKITKVSFILCQYPLTKPLPLSCGVLTHRNFGLVRIDTDAGLEGWGETSINFPPWIYQERRATLEDGLAGLLIGEDPLEPGRLWHKMTRAVRGFTRMWSEGALMQAIGGLDMALWDIVGREYGRPVSALLGGRFREEAEVYATGYSLDQIVSGSADYRAKGFRLVKVRVGFDDEADADNVHLAREALGPEIGLMVDANGAFSLPRARRMMRRLADCHLYWMEEPVLNDDLEGYLALRREFPDIPLAWGENGFSVDIYQQFTAARAVDIVMPDPSRSGGLTQCVRLCETASRYGLPFSPHHYGSDLGFAAALHLVASQPDFLVMLRDVSDCPLREEIITEPFEIKNGKVRVPDRPGLGVTPDLKTVERYRVKL
ncbi:MAG: mandelate racemase/muconate lactonizing enzyme family protein [Thermodesulfobacteriota bacterium]